LSAQIVQIHQANRGTYGVPRIHAELAERGLRCGRKRVARLMRAVGIAGYHRRVRTTQRESRALPAPDRVQRRFTATARNQLWTADITYVPTGSGFLYRAVVLEVFSQRIVGWAMPVHLRSGSWWPLWRWLCGTGGQPRGIYHSDQGSQ
jgi:transposase InsO family protein